MSEQELYLKMCRKVVAAAGTEEPLVAGDTLYYKCKAITIRAYETNTGNVYIGADNRVVSTDFSDILAPGESLEIRVPEPLWNLFYINMTHIWLDVDTSGDGVSFTAVTESAAY